MWWKILLIVLITVFVAYVYAKISSNEDKEAERWARSWDTDDWRL